MSHFFPHLKVLYWGYVGVLWWSTMYLSHHYLIDLTGGACLSVIMFYVTMPEVFKDVDQINWSASGAPGGAGEGFSYEMVDGRPRDELDLDEEIRKLEEQGEADLPDADRPKNGESSEAVNGGPVPKPKMKKQRSVSWGETKVLGEEDKRPDIPQSVEETDEK